jgi:hypothetical protein
MTKHALRLLALVLTGVPFLLLGCSPSHRSATTRSATTGPEAEPAYAVTFADSLSGLEGRRFFEIGTATPDADGNVYLSDRAGFRVVKIGPDGTVLAEAGERGQGSGTFEFPPHFVDLQGDRLLVAEPGSWELTLFDRDLSVVASITLDHVVMAPRLIDRETFVAYDMARERPVIYDMRGERVCEFSSEATGTRTSAAKLYVHGDRIHVLYSYRNLVETYDFNCQRTDRFRIEALAAQSGRVQTPTAAEDTASEEASRRPLLLHMDVHQGRYFVLSAMVDDDGQQTVFVRDGASGDASMSSFVLPHPSRVFEFGPGGVLYTSARQGQALVRYRLTRTDGTGKS